MKTHTILYAEDEKQTRLNYTEYLNIFFKEVYSVSNGQEALDGYNKYQPDILLLDINMPKINGLEVAQNIRLKDKITRIIILTAHLEQDKLLLATELNLTKYLPKPIYRNVLKETLNKAIEELKELKQNTDLTYFDDEHTWNQNTRELFKNQNQIKITKNEILLLELLSSQKNKIFTIDEISNELWNGIYDSLIITNKVKDTIKRLRKKLPKNCIENIYGAGYKLNFKT